MALGRKPSRRTAEHQPVITTLGSKSFFGEMALLNPNEHRAITTVRTKGFCEAFQLSAARYRQLLLQFPSFKEYVEMVARMRLADNLRKKSRGSLTRDCSAAAAAYENRRRGTLFKQCHRVAAAKEKVTIESLFAGVEGDANMDLNHFARKIMRRATTKPTPATFAGVAQLAMRSGTKTAPSTHRRFTGATTIRNTFANPFRAPDSTRRAPATGILGLRNSAGSQLTKEQDRPSQSRMSSERGSGNSYNALSRRNVAELNAVSRAVSAAQAEAVGAARQARFNLSPGGWPDEGESRPKVSPIVHSAGQPVRSPSPPARNIMKMSTDELMKVTKQKHDNKVDR